MYSGAGRLILGMRILILIVILVLFSIIAYPHVEEDVYEEESKDIDDYFKTTPTNYILIAAVITGILVVFSIYYKEKSERMKMLLFWSITLPIILATAYSAGSTIYLNLISETKGPIHWHADFEMWNCGKKIDLIEPKGLSNRVGTPVFHEHGDDRVHVEGVVVELKDVDLHTFFETVGGQLEKDYLYVPTNDGYVQMRNWDSCNGQEGKLQVFLYKIKNPDETKDWIFEQQKLDNFENYVLSPYSNVPPGDCIIIEFGAEKEKTDKICETYKIAVDRGDLSGG